MKQIALDGPAGAGKSTIAKKIAQELGFVYIDTGAMYRAIALKCIQLEIHISDEESVSEAALNADIDIRYINGEQHVFLDDRDVNHLIRTEEVSKAASDTSKYKMVRERLVALQQQLSEKYNVVMDGRDIGTVVLPNADLKIYMTASADIRAKRRYDEYKQKGMECSLEEIREDIVRRDHNDMNRENSPLMKACDAYELDTSEMGIEEVTEAILKLYHEKEQP